LPSYGGFTPVGRSRCQAGVSMAADAGEFVSVIATVLQTTLAHARNGAPRTDATSMGKDPSVAAHRVPAPRSTTVQGGRFSEVSGA